MCGTQKARGESDFSEPREEDTDYWNEDGPAVNALDAAADADDAADSSLKPRDWGNQHADAMDAAADADDAREGKAPRQAEDALDATADADDALDSKPPLTSWDMAKFANNVEAGGGTMGTK